MSLWAIASLIKSTKQLPSDKEAHTAADAIAYGLSLEELAVGRIPVIPMQLVEAVTQECTTYLKDKTVRRKKLNSSETGLRYILRQQ